MSGRLFVVGTPIGNLGDITQRALETLRAASHVFAEDTRRTRALLTHFGIEGKKLLSLHAHSPERVFEVALEVLEGGQSAALVSDAGMPTVSDPGTELVRRARARGIPVEVIPGPSAVTSAVALSGLVFGPFSFLGFLPRKGGTRRDALTSIARSVLPTVLFESPKRLGQTLRDLEAACGGEREVAVCRELTKQFEETVVMPVSQLAMLEREWRGEITLVVAGGSTEQTAVATPDLDQRIRELLERGLSARDVTDQLGAELLQSGQRTRRKELYARVLLAIDAEPGSKAADGEADEDSETDEDGETDEDSETDEDVESDGSPG